MDACLRLRPARRRRIAFSHLGLALVDVFSPCVTFNDHSGSTKSYLHTRKHELKATEADFVPPVPEILASIEKEGVTSVTMHDGSVLRFKSIPQGYDPTDRQKVISYLSTQQSKGEIVTGVLFVDEGVRDLHEMHNTSETPLARVAFEKLCPGSAELARLQGDFS